MVIKVTVIAVLLVLSMFSCTTSVDESKGVYEDPNYPQIPVDVEYSEIFEIDTVEGFQVIRIKAPYLENVHEYTLVPKGMDAPDDVNIIRTPVNDFALFSVSFIGYLEELGALGRVKYIESANYVYNEQVRLGVEKGNVLESGAFGQLNLEKLIVDSPELMLLNDFPESSDYLNKLLKSGIKVLPIVEWHEQHPLARAEWIKVFGALLDKEKEAEEVFENIKMEYNQVKSQVENDSTQTKVLFSAMYEGVWYMPGGKSYVAHLLQDANGTYEWSKTDETGSLSLSFEKVVLTSLENDVWIGPDAQSLDELYARDGRYKKFVDELSIGVYQACARISENGGNDYWESGVVRPDYILKDYVNILSPQIDDAELFYFRKLN